MIRAARHARADRIPDVDMTPMIDVVFLLIIFFMTTAQVARLTKADIDLPRQRGQTLQSDRPQSVVINIDAQGSFIVGGALATLDGVLADVRAEQARAREGAEPEFIVRADRAAPAASLNELAQRLADAGVRAWRLAASPLDAPAPPGNAP